jgi:C1A family cysteine protease
MSKKSIRYYGWQPDLPDHRDYSFQALIKVTKLPSKIDLRKQCPAVYNQGQLGSCTANAIAAAFEFEQMKQDALKVFMPSRLFIYYNERVMEHTVKTDSGAQIRDGIKSIHKQGVCPETLVPYNISKFAQKPSAKAYQAAAKNLLMSYHRVNQNINDMKSCLAQGYPFVFGFTVYDAFESAVVAKTGKLNMPTKNETVIGGHAVMAVDYDDANKRFMVRNSWCADWGMNGYFTMPYDYLLNDNLSTDFWTIRLVEENTIKKSKH